jgi:Acyl-CoA carboxylase epsilon subunit
MVTRTEPVLTLVKGVASPEELTALALVLLAREAETAGGADELSAHRRAAARWRAPAYGVATSWRTAS